MTELLSIVLAALFLNTNNSKYNEAMKAATEANYKTSAVKQYVDMKEEYIRAEYPLMTFLVGAGYIASTKKEITLRSSKIIKIDNFETNLHGTNKLAKIEFKFYF